MSQNEYLMLLGDKSKLYPLRDKFKKLGAFYTNIGWAFPANCKEELSAIIDHLPSYQICPQPLPQGQSFVGFRQTFTANFHRKKLREIEGDIVKATNGFSLVEFSENSIDSMQIDEEQKDLLLNLLYEKERLKDAIEHAEGMAKALNDKESQSKFIQIRSIAEFPTNYLKEKPLEKPKLLEFFHPKTHSKQVFLYKEIVANLIAEGGAGKTHLTFLLAFSIVTGIPFLQELEVCAPGSVCSLIGENNDGDIHRLVWKMNKYLVSILEKNKERKDGKNFSLHFEEPLEQISSKFHPISVHGLNSSFIDSKGNRTPFYHSFLEQLIAKEPSEGWQLITLDPLSRFAGLEAEKDNAIATAFISSLENISSNLKGKPTILLSHHKSKDAANKDTSGQTAGRGASAFTDGARWQANLDIKDKDSRTSAFYISKTNFTMFPPKLIIQKNYEGIPEFYEWEK